MMRSLFAGVQGMRAHQIRMDVIGNNIANVNTTAFKSSRVNFAEMYNQTIAGATAPGTARGGVNPKQMGLGVGVASIDTVMSEGSLQLTGRTTDMAVTGNGFFALRDGGRYVYSRAGNFDFDANGYLTNPATGQRVQGWVPNAAGNFGIREASTMTDIQLPVASSLLAGPTDLVEFDQSLNAAAPVGVGSVHTTATKVIDSLGVEHNITITFTKTAPNTWDIAATDANGTVLTLTDPYGGGTPQLRFNPDGSLVDDDANPLTPINVRAQVLDFDPANGAVTPQQFWLDFNKVIQPAIPGSQTTSTLRALRYNGYPTGALNRISLNSAGVVTGYYTNGQYRQVAQVALANFFNPGGLMKDGDNNWVESPNSGLALVGVAGEGGRGTIAPSHLEMSNVDISEEFTNMIVTQRGFQANSRVITSTDEMLQDVVNLKR